MADEMDIPTDPAVDLKIEKGGRKVSITFERDDDDQPFSPSDVVLELEQYLHDLSVALGQREKAGVKTH